MRYRSALSNFVARIAPRVLGTYAVSAARYGSPRAVLASAAAFQCNETASRAASDLLLSWATAGAGLQTKVDTRYLGAGNAKKYDAQAAAPVLDMQNASMLGVIAYVAMKLLEQHLDESQQDTVRQWVRGGTLAAPESLRP